MYALSGGDAGELKFIDTLKRAFWVIEEKAEAAIFQDQGEIIWVNKDVVRREILDGDVHNNILCIGRF